MRIRVPWPRPSMAERSVDGAATAWVAFPPDSRAGVVAALTELARREAARQLAGEVANEDDVVETGYR